TNVLPPVPYAATAPSVLASSQVVLPAAAHFNWKKAALFVDSVPERWPNTPIADQRSSFRFTNLPQPLAPAPFDLERVFWASQLHPVASRIVFNSYAVVNPSHGYQLLFLFSGFALERRALLRGRPRLSRGRA